MSLGIVIKGPEGLVLAAESRITLEARRREEERGIPVSYDNARKVLGFAEVTIPVGAVTYGLGAIGLRSAFSYISEFEASMGREPPSTVSGFANRLSEFFMNQWYNEMSRQDTRRYRGPNMTFVVCGFNTNEPYGRTYLIEIPRSPTPHEQNPDNFGITWGGQREIVDRLIRGYDERAINMTRQTLSLTTGQIGQLREALEPLSMAIPVRFLPLQDCVDLAIFFIRTTIEAQRLTVGIRGCGGPIDVATITRSKGFKWVQQKQIHGESLTISPPS